MVCVGDTLEGRFLLKERLGEGGTGVVFAALDTGVGQKVAVKILHRDLADATSRERLRREVRAARPGHPNMVTVFDLHDHNGLSFLSMELVGGSSLGRALHEKGKLAVEETVRMGVQVAAALEHLHDKGLVHRDVKPSNILMTRDGAAKLGDLGLVRPVDRGTTVTETEMVVGTPAYMAPEQATAAGLTPASDIYALGLTLYRCLSGEVPLEGRTAVETLMLRQKSRPPRIRDTILDCPRWLDRLLRWMLEPDPGDRPRADQVIAALSSGRVAPRLSRRALTSVGIGLLVMTVAVMAGLVIRERLTTTTLDPTAGLMYRVEPFENGSSVEILDDLGNPLQRVTLNWKWEPERFGESSRRALAFGDLNGDGAEDAVIARQSADADRPLEVYLRRPDGSLGLEGAYPATHGLEYEGRTFVGFEATDVHCADLTGDGRSEIVLVEHSDAFYPSTVRVLSSTNETLFQLWHPGVLSNCQTADRDGDGRFELYVGGTCNFLTPPDSNTSEPVLMVVDADWNLRGQVVDLFAPGRQLAQSVPNGVRLTYAAWDRLVVPSYQNSWQMAVVGLINPKDPYTFLSVAVSEVDGPKIGLKHNKRLAIRYVYFNPDLEISEAMWSPQMVEVLGLDTESPGMQALLLPRYWTGARWSEETVFLPMSE